MIRIILIIIALFIINPLALAEEEEKRYEEITLPSENKIIFGQINQDDLGIKIMRESDLFDYSVGIQNINKAGGWLSIKPARNFELGSGFFTNRLAVEDSLRQTNTLSLFSKYKYKRFSVKGEFLRKDYVFYDDKYYDSWHLSKKYALTKNISLKAGYKEREESQSTINDFGIEYSKDNLKLEMDTSFVKYKEDEERNSQRFGINTKYFF